MAPRTPAVIAAGLLQMHVLLLLCARAENGEQTAAAVRLLQSGIRAAIERPLRRHVVRGGVSGSGPPDVNLMLGVSMMEGQMMSCAEHSQTNNGFDRTHLLTRMTNELYAIFYDRNLPDMETIGRILDRKLWTSPEQIVPIGVTLGSHGYADFLDNATDLFFRDVSDECIRRVVTSCDVAPECAGLEFANGLSGYALTHQVLYVHILKRTCCDDDPTFRELLETIIRHKCSKIFKEASYIASDSSVLEKYKDLFIEQIAICGVQNIVEFIRPEWLSIIILSSRNTSNCSVQYQNNNYRSCESHLTGVSLAALGVYWKFLCYKANTISYSEHNNNNILP